MHAGALMGFSSVAVMCNSLLLRREGFARIPRIDGASPQTEGAEARPDVPAAAEAEALPHAPRPSGA